MTELLDRDLDADLVFAVNDVMAVGAIAALREQGHRVPQDMAVAGFDDIPTLRDVRPALTTVRVPLGEMGRHALRLALDEAAEPDGERRGARRAPNRTRGGHPGEHRRASLTPRGR